MSQRTQRLSHAFRVDDGKGFRLADCDPGECGGLKASKDGSDAALVASADRIGELQEKLYAHNRWSLLLVFQAMDAAGKDGTIKHVLSGADPQGCQAHAFKVPSDEELDHDFLWRCAVRLPERGRLGVFNRSYYEEVLVVRVHPEFLDRQRLPAELRGKKLWDYRFESIRAFEKHLARNGTVVLKFFLNVSREEQKRRFLKRIDDPSKNWKFSSADVREGERWDEYMEAYEHAIRETAAPHAPWYVVPADAKWFTRLVVSDAIAEALEGLDLSFPKLDAARRAELDAARRELGT